MIDDPIVEEIRRYRQEHAARYGNDIHRIFSALREKEHKSGRNLVDLGPKKLSDQQRLSRVAENPAEYNAKKPKADER